MIYLGLPLSGGCYILNNMKKIILLGALTLALVSYPLVSFANLAFKNHSYQWGWDYIDGGFNGKSGFKASGKGVDVFIIDTGVDSVVAKVNLAGSKDFTVDNGTALENKDCLGHGTAVASLIAGKGLGAANSSRLFSAKVFSCGDGGTYVGNGTIRQALEWVDSVKVSGKPTIVNMSITSSDVEIKSIVEKLASSGVVIVASAGNNSVDACAYYPVNLPNTIGVGALSNSLSPADYTNFGSCVDFYAAGSETKVYCDDNKNGCTLHGSSMSSAFVTGMTALFLEKNISAGYAEVTAWLNNNSKLVDSLKHVQLPVG
jgi:subtilisin family serine protease